MLSMHGGELFKSWENTKWYSNTELGLLWWFKNNKKQNCDIEKTKTIFIIYVIEAWRGNYLNHEHKKIIKKIGNLINAFFHKRTIL